MKRHNRIRVLNPQLNNLAHKFIHTTPKGASWTAFLLEHKVLTRINRFGYINYYKERT